MIKIKCPCCGYFTHLVASEGEPLFEICNVCFWQYDAVAHDRPGEISGANGIALNDAIENYKKFGVCEERFKNFVRKPYVDELPNNNSGLANSNKKF